LIEPFFYLLSLHLVPHDAQTPLSVGDVFVAVSFSGPFNASPPCGVAASITEVALPSDFTAASLLASGGATSETPKVIVEVHVPHGDTIVPSTVAISLKSSK
jgi:hypothetical protein